MALTVDDADKEERLALVCDYAWFLEIGDEEMQDVIQLVRFVYRRNDKNEM